MYKLLDRQNFSGEEVKLKAPVSLYNQTYVSNAGSQFKHLELSLSNKQTPETVYQSNFKIAPA